MKIAFFNPQGNFDENDSHLTQHPDFGGQLIYVKELAKAMSKYADIDIITRYINDEKFPQFDKEIDYYNDCENIRIIRIKFGGERFLRKELLWNYLEEYVDKIIEFYGDDLPDFVTSHYGDGGYAAALFKSKTDINYTFTGHSLGAQKLEKMCKTKDEYIEQNKYYFFDKRLLGERIAIKNSYKIITSTIQEKEDQYTHYLYKDIYDKNKIEVIPPGVNLKIFNNYYDVEKEMESYIRAKTNDYKKQSIILSSRLDEKKNHINVVKAYASSERLQEIADLCIFIRNVPNPYEIDKLNEKDRKILEPIIKIIKENDIIDKVFFLEFNSQLKLAHAYKYFSKFKSIFVLTSLYEPFGLAPIEAAACNLAVVATKNGGPSEIFEDGSGVLVDPLDISDIERGMFKALNNYDYYSNLGRKRVLSKYTWENTAKEYLNIIKEGLKKEVKSDIIHFKDIDKLINDYYKN